jgi:phosphoribosylaminoimidazolecarboxamide formyltransferase/IMP cyclohydrolase
VNALKVLKNKKNLRIIDASKLNNSNLKSISSLFNNFLIQTPDVFSFSKSNFKVVSKNKPNSQTFKNLIFAFNVCRFVKSNAIVILNKDSTIGIGSGQPSRLDSCEIAINKMKRFHKEKLEDQIIAASDAFFPFVDGIEKLVQAGVSAIIQPAGSIRDKDVIRFANKTNTILVFSKTRHFRH